MFFKFLLLLNAEMAVFELWIVFISLCACILVVFKCAFFVVDSLIIAFLSFFFM